MVRRYFLIRHRTCVCKQCSGLKRVYREGWIRRIDENAADASLSQRQFGGISDEYWH